MDEAEARQILNLRAKVLVDVVEKGWAAMVAEERTRSRRARAGIVYDYMVAEAQSTLAPLAGVRPLAWQGNAGASSRRLPFGTHSWASG